MLMGKEAEAMKQRLCGAPSVAPELARGQDSALCHSPSSRALHASLSPPAGQ